MLSTDSKNGPLLMKQGVKGIPLIANEERVDDGFMEGLCDSVVSLLLLFDVDFAFCS